MTDLPREKLCELIATYGRALCDDPRRCEALLRDLCAANRREIHALVSALRERVAADLLAASEGVPREVLRARLTQRLQDNLGLAEEIARWAVDSWALALGKLSPAQLSAAPASSSTARDSTPPAAPSRRRPLILAGLGVGVVFLAILIIALLNSPHQPPQGDQDRAQRTDVAFREFTVRPESQTTGGPLRCGVSLVEYSSGDMFDGGGHVRITSSKSGKARIINGITIREIACKQLAHKPGTVLLIQDYSGGAHCCTDLYIYGVSEEVKLLGVVDALDGELDRMVEFKDLQGGGNVQVVIDDLSSVTGLAYFGPMSYSVSPALPFTLCLEGQTYTDCTNQFPSFLRREYEAAILQMRRASGSGERRPEAVKALALAILLGEEQAGWNTVQEIDPEVARFWAPYAEELRAKLRNRSKNIREKIRYTEEKPQNRD